MQLARSSNHWQRVELLLAERNKQLAEVETLAARLRVSIGASEQPSTPERMGHRKKPSVSLANTSSAAPFICAHLCRLLRRCKARYGDRYYKSGNLRIDVSGWLRDVFCAREWMALHDEGFIFRDYL